MNKKGRPHFVYNLATVALSNINVIHFIRFISFVFYKCSCSFLNTHKIYIKLLKDVCLGLGSDNTKHRVIAKYVTSLRLQTNLSFNVQDILKEQNCIMVQETVSMKTPLICSSLALETEKHLA